MLKIDIGKNKNKLEVGVGGSLPEILSDLGTAIHVIHVRMCRKNVLFGLEFEKAIRNPKFWDLVFRPQEGDSEMFGREEKDD